MILDLSSQLSQRENNGNLTEYNSIVLGSKRRRKRNPLVAIGGNETILSTYPQMNHVDHQPSNNNDVIWDGEIDINSNYTGFLEIIGMCTQNILII